MRPGLTTRQDGRLSGLHGNDLDTLVVTPEPRTDPQGPATGKQRVLRGGSWDATPNFIRPAVRYRKPAGYRNSSFGFRCARSLDDRKPRSTPAAP